MPGSFPDSNVVLYSLGQDRSWTLTRCAGVSMLRIPYESRDFPQVQCKLRGENWTSHGTISYGPR